jgi:hypothetical protein
MRACKAPTGKKDAMDQGLAAASILRTQRTLGYVFERGEARPFVAIGTPPMRRS